MAEASSFLHSYQLPNKKWFEKGVKTASPTKTDQVTAFRVLGFPNVALKEVQKIWQENEDFVVDPRIEGHMAV